MLHIHVLLVAPLSTGDMAEPGADRHQRRVPSWETAYHAGPPAEEICRFQVGDGPESKFNRKPALESTPKAFDPAFGLGGAGSDEANVQFP